MLETIYPVAAVAVIVLGSIISVVLIMRVGAGGWRLAAHGAGYAAVSGILVLVVSLILGFAIPADFSSPEAMREYNLTLGVFVAVIGGLIGEVLRWLWLRNTLKEVRLWTRAVQFGAGAALLGVVFTGLGLLLSHVGMLVQGSMQIPAAQLAELPAEQQAAIQATQALVAEYWAVAWYAPLLMGLNVLIIALLQIALTVLVLQVFTQRNFTWLIFAVGFSVFSSVLYAVSSVVWSPIITTALVLVLAGAALGLTLWLRGYDDPSLVAPEARTIS